MDDCRTQFNEIEAKFSNNLLHAQVTYNKVTDQYLLDSSSKGPTFRGGDRVCLLQCNVKTIRSYDKLVYQHLGPFVISHKIYDVTFCLDFRGHVYLHVVFLVSLLEPCVPLLIPSWAIPPACLSFLRDQIIRLELFWNKRLCITSYTTLWTDMDTHQRIGYRNMHRMLVIPMNLYKNFVIVILIKPCLNLCIATDGIHCQRRG